MTEIACNNCGSTHYKVLFYNHDRLHKVDNEEFRIVQCAVCGLVYLNPQPSESELARYYPEHYGPYNQQEIFVYGGFTKRLRSLIRSFRQWRDETPAPDTSKLAYLDFGCGSGNQLENVRTAHPHWELWGMDNSEVACRRAREKGFQVMCGDITKVTMPRDFFQKVNMSQVIEHLIDPKSVLKKINESMKMGGELIVSTPNIDSYAAKMFGNLWWALETPRHTFLFEPKTLTSMLESAGFKVSRITYDPGPKVFIRSIYYYFGKDGTRGISPIIWRIFKPFSALAARLGKSSGMAVYAHKVRTA